MKRPIAEAATNTIADGIRNNKRVAFGGVHLLGQGVSTFTSKHCGFREGKIASFQDQRDIHIKIKATIAIGATDTITIRILDIKHVAVWGKAIVTGKRGASQLPKPEAAMTVNRSTPLTISQLVSLPYGSVNKLTATGSLASEQLSTSPYDGLTIPEVSGRLQSRISSSPQSVAF